MFRIGWKSFVANIRNFLAFFLSIIISVNVLFLLMYIREFSKKIKGIETKALAFAYSSELSKQLRVVIPFVVFAAILVIAYSIKFYINSRMEEYGIFKILGIRKIDMRNMIIVEYTMGCILSCIIGLFMGWICSSAFKIVLQKKIGQSFAGTVSMNKVYLMTLIVCIVMILGAVFAIFVVLDAKGTEDAIRINVVKEKRGISPISLVWLVMGISLICLSFWVVKNNPMSANIAIFLLCFGVFVSICFGFGYIMEKYRKTDYFCSKILEWDQFYHYFNRHKFQIIIQALLGIIIIYFSFLMLRGTLDSRLMPNDFVCIEKSDGKFMETFQKKFHGEDKTFPFVWVNEAAGDSWIGMSVNDYNKIFEKDEELQKNEVIRIWREEGTTEDMLDNSQEKKMPGIALGKCTNSDTEDSVYAYNFSIKKEEVNEIIGFSMSGIVVLADVLFDEAVKENNFHQKFMIMNVEPSKLDTATRFVEEQKAKGVLEEAFCRQIIEDIDGKESILNRFIVGIVAFVVLFYGIFVMWLSHLSELSSSKEKYKFLSIMGVYPRNAKKILYKEIGRTNLISIVISVGVIAVFCKTFIDSYYNGMQGSFDKSGAEKLLIIILCVYLLVEIIYIQVSRNWIRKQIVVKE